MNGASIDQPIGDNNVPSQLGNRLDTKAKIKQPR